MEQNLSDALKMAAAVLFFVGALSLAIIGLSNTRSGAVGVIESYSSMVEFYNYPLLNSLSTKDATGYTKYDLVSDDSRFIIESERVVGMETILPNVFDYYDSGYTILFYYLIGNEIKPLRLYRTQSLVSDLYYSKLRIIEDENHDGKITIEDDCINCTASNGIITDISLKNVDDAEKIASQIYGLDLTDEAIRKEPWLQSKEACRRFVIDLFNNLTILPNDLLTINKTEADNIKSKYFIDNSSPSIYETSNNGKDHDRGNTYGKVDNGDNDYFFYSLNFTYDGLIGGSSLSQCKGKFIERVGIYNNTTITELSEDAGKVVMDMGSGTVNIQTHTDSDTGEEIETYRYISTDAAASRHVIQYIYIGNNNDFDGILHDTNNGVYINN